MAGKPVLKTADLFAGAGGLTLGFAGLSRGRFKPVFAIDNNQHAIRTYNANFGDHGISGDILEFMEADQIPRVDLVIGGPPCQGFSLLNKNRDSDTRKEMWRPYMDFVVASGASAFLIENVPQLLGTEEHERIQAFAREHGFRTVSTKLVAADYGVPQTRQRAFILGTRFDFPEQLFPPRRTHYDPRKGPPELDDPLYVSGALPWRTVRDSVSDLKTPRSTEIRDVPGPYDLHFRRNPTELSKKRYRAIPGEGMNRVDLLKNAPELTPPCWVNKKGGTDLFGRLWWDRPSVTIRTEFFKPEKGRYLHPSQHRPITHREAARFQSFPDEFKFLGSKTEIARQIGNAVPPGLTAHIADVVYDIITKYR